VLRRVKATLASIGATSVIALAVSVSPASAYNPINPIDANQTIVLNGHNLTVDKLVAIARYGAKVELSDAARQRSLNAYYLLLEGSREGIPIYFFNRGTGAGRQNVIFSGDPLSTQVTSTSPTCPTTGVQCSNEQFLLQRQLATFQNGARGGLGPEVNDEEIVRAMMAERVNTMSYEAATPQVTQMLIDLLNRGVTPVVESRGSPGEGDLPQMGNVEATMVGAGQAYHHGVKMAASQALTDAGLQPLQKQPAQAQLEAPGAPFAADDAAVTSTNAFTMGQAGLLIYDAQRMLNWQDLVYAMELEGMNSSVTPIAAPVQASRPFAWLNADAARTLDEISGSYLFNLDQLSSTNVPFRIIQDPESLRALSQRNGSAWEAWNQLKQDLTLQMNSSDHNPAVTPGWSPKSSPELSTPWFMQYHVAGGADNANCYKQVQPDCSEGYILSNANWDPYPVDNEIEALTNALANIAVNDDMVPLRFENTFFTVIAANDPSLPANQISGSAPGAADYTLADLLSEIQLLQNPVAAQGNSIISTVEDLQAEGRIKVSRARLMVDDLMWLLGQDLLTATRWMNIRQIQGQTLGLSRGFGAAPTAAWDAFRQVVPWQEATRPDVPPGQLAYDFLQGNPASLFYPPASKPPTATENVSVSFSRLVGAISRARARTARFRSGRASSVRTFLLGQAFAGDSAKSRRH
jgi:histidine ammonia-lyase